MRTFRNPGQSDIHVGHPMKLVIKPGEVVETDLFPPDQPCPDCLEELKSKPKAAEPKAANPSPAAASKE